MRQIKSIDGKRTVECHMSAGKGMQLQQKLGRNIFALNDNEALMQIAGLNPSAGYELFMELTKVTVEELDQFDTEQIWEFLEGVFVDFFPGRIQKLIPELLKKVRESISVELLKSFESTDAQNAVSSSVTGSAA